MRCFLVEDEENLNTLLSFSLKQEGYEVESFFNYKDAAQVIGQEPDAWIVDINLPDGSGLDLVKEIKAKNKKEKVLIISARDTEIDRLLGLEIGSDDYITKPFLPRELIIRLGRLLESTKITTKSYGVLDIDFEKRRIFDAGEDLDFTSKEFDVTALFAKHPNQPFTRDQILTKIWGDDYFGSERVVDDIIRRIRKKSDNIPIETVYGYGYRWCGNEA